MPASRRRLATAGISFTAVSALTLAVLTAAPAAATASLSSVWPDSGRFITANIVGADFGWYNESDEDFEFMNGQIVGPGEFGGYRVDVVEPETAPPLPPCTSAGGADVAESRWAFVDDALDVIADAETFGMGWSDTAQFRSVLVQAPENITTPLVGSLSYLCTHTTVADVVQVSLPLTIVTAPPSTFATPNQYTINDFEAGRTATLNAMGFAPGENVKLSLVDSGDGTPTVAAQAQVIADAAGGVAASYLVPGNWSGSGELLVVGPTSRRALSIGIWPGSLIDREVTLTATLRSGGSTGRIAHVAITGYDENANVVVSLHSASASSVLGTLTTDASGNITGDLEIPAGITGAYQLWAGEKTGGYFVLSRVFPLATFSDVSSSTASPNYSAFASEITWLASTGITTGYDLGGGKVEYRPFASVTRDAMAAFLYRYAGSPSFTPPVVSPFVDVPTSNGFYKEITWLASTGLSTGWDIGGGKKEFRPYSPITRDAMAAFLYRYAESPAFTAPPVSPFADVPTSNGFYTEVTWLASTGVSTGWAVGAGKEFRPYNAITRDAMAAFLYRYDAL